jgi:hypothetical protein
MAYGEVSKEIAMDVRHLKDGKVRVRLKLNKQAFDAFNQVWKDIDCPYACTALERLSLEFLSSYDTDVKVDATGIQRLLIRLYPDQYELFQSALAHATGQPRTPENILYQMCLDFSRTYGDVQNLIKRQSKNSLVGPTVGVKA